MLNMKAVISSHNKNILAKMALWLHPRNNPAHVTAEISRNAHFKESVCKRWFTKRQLPQKRQRKTMSDSLQISKNGIETIRSRDGICVCPFCAHCLHCWITKLITTRKHFCPGMQIRRTLLMTTKNLNILDDLLCQPQTAYSSPQWTTVMYK